MNFTILHHSLATTTIITLNLLLPSHIVFHFHTFSLNHSIAIFTMQFLKKIGESTSAQLI